MNQDGQIGLKDHGLGYKYQDVIKVEPIDQDNQVNGALSQMRVANNKAIVTLDFRDWKWLSNFQRFTSQVEDEDVLNGSKEGIITVDFSKLA